MSCMQGAFKKIDIFAFLAIVATLAAVACFFYGHGRILEEHIVFVRGLHEGTQLVPHPGVFLLASLWSHLSGYEISRSLSHVLILHFTATFIALFWCLRQFLHMQNDRYIYMLLALCLMLASPIGLPLINPWVYNFGYNSRMPFGLHNATHIGLLPYMFLSFGLLCRILKNPEQHAEMPYRTLALFSCALFFSTLVKPSFSISLIPAIACYFLINRKKYNLNIYAILFALLPSSLLILIQYYVGFVHNPLGKTIEYTLMPFQVWEENNKLPILSFFLACLFPLWVSLIRYRCLTSPTKIAWINLFIALIPYILFAETKEYGDRNFEWSYLHARMILFLCCAGELVLWIRAVQPKSNPSSISLTRTQLIAGIIFGLHCAFGYFRFIIYLSPNLLRAGGLY